MLNSENLLFRLPQTVIRSLGIPELTRLNFFQGNIAKNSKPRMGTAADEIAINKLNKEIIFAASDGKSPIIYDLFDSKNIVPENTILDFNLISFCNLPSMKNLRKPIVLPYSSEVYNPIKTDLLDPYGLLRCLKNSLYIRKQIKPKYFYDWASMICKNSNKGYIPWYWQPLQMNLELYLARMQKVASSLKTKYRFFHDFMESENPILIQYSGLGHNTSIGYQIESLYKNNRVFRSEIKKSGTRIFIKPHRSKPFMPENSLENFNGVEIRYAENLQEHYLPSEIFLNSRTNKYLFISEWSSAVYNFQISKFLPIKSKSIPQFDDLLLTSRRLAQYNNFNPNSVFK